ncbi:hypothetical protein Tco_1198027 [Tanacetum coccineum]
MKGRVKKHSVETRRRLILVKNDNERVRVRCEGTIPALVPYVAIDTNMDKNVLSQTKGDPVIRENRNSGKQNILGKDKIMEEKGKKMGNHVIKSLATNLDILVRAVQDQMQKQFKVEVSKMKAFREKIIASDNMTGSFREQYTLFKEYAQELINQNLGTTVRIDDLSVAYVIVEAESKRYRVRHIHENMKSQFKGGVYKEMLWNVAKATSEGRAKCDLLINNICEAFNRQLVDGRDQLIITCLEYIIEYLMKMIVVVQKVIANTVGPLTPSVIKMFDDIKKKATKYNVQWNRVGRRPKKRNKSNDEIASQSASSGKLSRKGKSVSYDKCGNIGHNRKACRGQGDGSSHAGAKKVSGQAVGSRKVSGQAVGAKNVSGQADSARNVSG